MADTKISALTPLAGASIASDDLFVVVDTSGVVTASMTHAELFIALKTIDGTGSGLDADLLDGQEGAYHLAMENMVEAADAKVLTAAERTKLGYVTITQAVDLDQMEIDIAALANGMVYSGDWDASSGSFPGGGTAQVGAFYYVSVAGTVDSVAFVAGDNIVATTDNASTATYAANWSKHDQTDAVQSVAGKTGSVTLVEADITDLGSYQPLDAALTDIAGITLATGDVFYADGSGNIVKLAAGTNGHYLSLAEGIPAWAAVAGGGDALVANPLSQFAATTSAQLAGVLSDETGSGAAVFATSPTLVTPALGTPTALVLTNATDLPIAAIGDGILTLAKQADMATASLVGRSTAGTGVPEILSATTARTLLNVEDGATADQTGAQIKVAYEGEADTNAFTDARATKVDHLTVTQAVDLDQMETDIAALANGMVYAGDWDASSGSFPGSGSAQTGAFYYVSVAGTVDSVVFAVGDNIVATTDNASTATYAANWSKHDQTDAVQSVAGRTGAVVLAAGDIASGTMADARIAASNVTQHEGQLRTDFTLAEAIWETGTNTTKAMPSPADIAAAIAALESGGGGGGGLLAVTVITSSTTWNRAAGATKALVRATGGGGGGASGNATDNAGGGGGGGTSEKFIDITSIATATVTIGAAGSAGSSGEDGGDGGTTTWSDGTNTLTGNGGSKGLNSSRGPQADGGAGGSASGGDINHGGNAGQSANGNDDGQGSSGGGSIWGGGGAGRYTTTAGLAGTARGAGGGGSTDANGGAGVAGVVYVMEYA